MLDLFFLPSRFYWACRGEAACPAGTAGLSRHRLRKGQQVYPLCEVQIGVPGRTGLDQACLQRRIQYDYLY